MQKQAFTFVGGLNTDADPRLVDGRDYIAATDILNTEKDFGSLLRAQGNEEMVNTQTSFLAAGTNTTIGAFENTQTSDIFYFIHNSGSQHRIIRYSHITGLYHVVARGPGLGFSLTNPIHSLSFADDWMIWTDGRVLEGDVLSKGEPCRLNWRDAILADKNKEYNLVFESDPNALFQEGNTYRFRIRNIDTGVVSGSSPIITMPANYAGDLNKGAEYLAAQINSAYGTSLLAEACDCHIKVTVIVNTFYITLETNGGDAALMPTNHIAREVTASQIKLVQPVPSVNPVVTLEIGEATDTTIWEGELQFRIRYHFRGGHKSAWGAVSHTPIYKRGQFAVLGGQYSQKDYQKEIKSCEVDYTDPVLSNPDYYPFITHVEIAVRKGAAGVWKQAALLDRCEVGLSSNKFVFKQTEGLPVIPSDDPSVGNSDTQVLRNNDNVPLAVSTLITDVAQDGHSRLFLHGCKEGFDAIDCTDTTIEPELDLNSTNKYITGRLALLGTGYSPGTPAASGNGLGIVPVYLAGTDYYTLVMPSDWSGGTAEFIIGPLKSGKYIVRCASPYCRFDDGNSPKFNLANGREWHNTSAPMANEIYEKEVDLLAVQAVDIGQWDMWDPRTDDNGTNSWVFVDGYYLKDKNNTFLSTGYDAFQIEKSQAFSTFVPENAPLTSTVRTDHNGYFFFSYYNTNPDKIRFGQGGTLDNISGWRGSFQQLRNGLLQTLPGSATEVDISGTAGQVQMMVHNEDSTFGTFISTQASLVTGLVLNSLSQGVRGIRVMCTRTGRVAVTDLNGAYRLYVMGENTQPSGVISEDLFFFDPSDGYYDRPFTPATQAVTTTAGTPLFVSDTTVPNAALRQNKDLWERRLKLGGVYGIGIVYEDEFGRTNGVQPIGDIRMPLRLLKDLTPKFYKLKFTIRHKAPTWARRYRFVRTKNKIHAGYATVWTDDVKWYKASSSGALTAGLASAATYVGLEYKVPTAGVLLPELDAQPTYTPEIGDIARIVHVKTTQLTDGSVYEGRVVGTYLDGGKNYALVDGIGTLADIQSDSELYVEYIKESSVDTGVYYEACDTSYEVLAGGYHKGELSSQDLTPGSVATGYIRTGDTYIRHYTPNSGTNDNIFLEYPYGYGSRTEYATEDIGRPFVEDADAKESFIFNRIRFSGIYIPNSNINNLGIFGALDAQHINRDYGPIVKAICTPSSMLCICKHRVQPLYVGRGRMLDLRGAESVGRSDQILHIADASRMEAGTLHPTSVVVHGTMVYFWDRIRHAFWRFGPDGISRITQGVRFVMDAYGGEREKLSIVNDRVFAGFDPNYNLYFVTFGQGSYIGPAESTVVVPQRGMVYAESDDRWKCDTNLLPDCHCSVHNTRYALKEGKVWKHTDAALKANYFGVQYTPSVTFVVNQEPQEVKDLLAIEIQGHRRWSALPVATLEADTQMLSRIPLGDFVKKERNWFANFLRDENDPHPKFLSKPAGLPRLISKLRNGRYMKGRVFSVKIIADEPSLVDKMESVFVKYKLSR